MIVSTRSEGSRLAGNLLDDPAERDLYVYLPQGYEDSDARYPTAYLRHPLEASAETTVFPENDGIRWILSLEDVLDPVFGRMGVPPISPVD